MATPRVETAVGVIADVRRVSRGHLRDGLLAGLALVGLLWALGTDGRRRLRDPVAALLGVGTALTMEWAFLRYPERLLSLWERPLVSLGSALGLLAAGVAARDSPRLVAAGCWGLVTYLLLLARVLGGGTDPRE